MSKKGLRAIIAASVLALSLFTTGCGGGDDGEEVSTPESGEETSAETESSEEESLAPEIMYDYNVGADWRFAYSHEGYDFYYMNVSEEKYDPNIILSVTTDEGLKGVSAEQLKETLREQYGEDVVPEDKEIAGLSAIYWEIGQEDGEIKAYVGQYVVLGKDMAVIFSVYAKETEFETAKESAGRVAGSISFME